MFWVICAAMVVLVGGAIALPLIRPQRDATPTAAYDLGVYRDQLREVDRDVGRGVLTEDEAARLRTDIGRKVLDADRALAAATQDSTPPRRGLAALALGTVLAGSAALYALELGSPQMPDAPIKLRFAKADEMHKNRPSQAEAEKNAPALSVPTPDPKFVALIDQLRTAVANRPTDIQGLTLLARYEAQLGHLVAAKDAQAKLIAAKGNAATAMDHVTLAFLMTEAAGGLITAETEAELGRALAIDPQNGQARYMQGLLFAQNGRPDRTFPIWAELLDRGPENAPWIAPIRGTIRDLAWIAGHPEYEPPAPETAPGPDAAALAAAGDMTPEARQKMVSDMVSNLETRLANEGGTPDEWARLISSLSVMGQIDHARDIWGEAQAKFKDQPDALATIAVAADHAGLTGNAPAGAAAPEALPGPSAADMQSAAQMAPQDRQKMIADMVGRLKTRLEAEGGTPTEWARLVTSLAMLGDRSGAEAALEKGRAASADNRAGLGVLDAAASDAGLQ